MLHDYKTKLYIIGESVVPLLCFYGDWHTHTITLQNWVKILDNFLLDNMVNKAGILFL